MKKKIYLLLILAILSGLSYSALFGRLAPLLPFMIGFEKKISNNVIVYYNNPNDIRKLLNISELISQTENFHGMRYLQQVEIAICNTDNEYERLTGSKTRFISYFNGRIFISKRAWNESLKGDINLNTYLKHELSHTLIQQHTTLIQLANFPKWLLEGIAMANADQAGTGIYPSKEEVSRFIKQEIFFNPDDFGTWISPQNDKTDKFILDNKIAFFYSEFGCIINDLILRYGEHKFHQFLNGIITEDNYKEVFFNIYGIRFENYISIFKNDISII